MLKKKLEYLPPKFVHTPFDTQTLSLLAVNDSSNEWQMFNFLHLCINKNSLVDNFFPPIIWKTCPFINVYSLPYEYIDKNFKNFTDFLVSILADDNYVYALINMKYINEYHCLKNEDHNPLIIGVDEINKTVKIADFFSGQYKVIDCSFEEINKSFIGLKECEAYDVDNYCSAKSFYYILNQNNSYEYQFVPEYFIEELKDFLKGTNLYEKHQTFAEHDVNQNKITDYIFGIHCYNFILNENVTKRIMSLLLLHSDIWLKRILFFKTNNIIEINDSLVNDTKKLFELSKINLYLLMKLETTEYNYNYNKKTLGANVLECKILEERIVNYIIKHMERKYRTHLIKLDN